MAFEIGDVLRAVVKTNLPDGVEAVNVFDWVRNDAEPSSPFVGAVVDAAAQKMIDCYTLIQGDMSNLATVTDATFYVMAFDTGRWIVDQLAGVEPIGVPGLSTGELLPHGVAALLTMATAQSKRRGRRFFPGYAEDAAVDGIWTAAAVVRVLDFATAYLLDLTVTGGYTLGPRLLSTTGSLLTFTSSAASGTPAYQRRRKPGVGS